MLKNKIALLGLSADPLHWGHIAYIEACKSRFLNHLIVIMPCKTNPLGKVDELGENIYPMDGNLRFQMLYEYFKDDSRIVVSRYEIDNPNPSYTIHTIHYLQHVQYTDLLNHVINPKVRDTIQSDITLLIGTDNFLQLPAWYRWKEILAESCIVIMRRKGYPQIISENINHAELKQAFIARLNTTGLPGTIMQFDGPQIDISSTLIKKMIREGANDEILSQYLPLSILKFIRAHCRIT